MSSSRAIKPRREDTLLTGWESVPETAPSIMREDRPTVARVVAMIGAFFILVGLIPIVAPLMKLPATVIGTGWSFFLITTGLMLVFFHAFVDQDRVFRRLYAGMGLIAIAVAVLVRVLPSAGGVGAWFPLIGLPALALGLILLIATARQEPEKGWRTFLVNVLGAVGAAMILTGVGVGLFSPVTSSLPGQGVLHLIVGLFFVAAFISLQDTEKLGYYAGLALGGVGLIAFAGGLIRSMLPESTFLVPSGLILMSMGIVYLASCAAVCVDWPIIVLTRREFASNFYSPIAYLLLVGMVALGWFMFRQFMVTIFNASGGAGDPRMPSQPMFEPIVAQYVFELFLVIVQMFIVPALTMRLLAEEQRTGTLEVLLTAPVTETTVVISKFLGAWLFYLLTWVPWWLNLVALRYMGGEPFDYRPLLTFNVAMLAVGAGFISMGLFFSSLTRNQIIAAVLTFVGMIAHLAAYIVKFRDRMSPGDFWFDVLTYVSFLDLWMNTLEGTFTPRFLLFHISATVFFLFATVKVLEARKWK
jgi:ABC-2 type transport system permease protein